MVSQSKNNLVAILIPMFNEENVASLCIESVLKEIKKIPTCTLFVVNDGSSDKTAEILDIKKRKFKSKITILTHKKNKGYGAALQTGMKKAKDLGYTWILHMDSDLTNDPKYIKDFLNYCNSTYDCIKASRYIKGAQTINVPRFRIFFSVVGNHIASAFFNIGINDCTNGFRMVRLEKLNGVIFKENNFSIILEEIYFLKKRGATFHEIPYTLTARTNSLSHFAYKPKTFYDYFKYAFKSALNL